MAASRVVVMERRCEEVSALVMATAMVITMPRMNSTTTISTSVKPRAWRGVRWAGAKCMAAVMIPSAPIRGERVADTRQGMAVGRRELGPGLRPGDAYASSIRITSSPSA